MPAQNAWKFTCGHHYARVMVSPGGFPILPDRASTREGPKTSTQQCPDCKEQTLATKEEEKQRLEKLEETVAAYKAHADFLALQIKSNAAKNDKALWESFQKCLGDCKFKWASAIKTRMAADHYRLEHFVQHSTLSGGVSKLVEELGVISYVGRFDAQGIRRSLPADFVRVNQALAKLESAKMSCRLDEAIEAEKVIRTAMQHALDSIKNVDESSLKA